MKRTKFILLGAIVATMMPGIMAEAQELPSYYLENGYIDKKISSIPKGKSFIFITDSHIQRNAGNQTRLPAYVTSKAKISMTVFGGDCFDWAPDAVKAKEHLSAAFNEYESSLGNKFLWIQGNHDCNSSAVTKYKIPYQTAEVCDKDAYELTIGRIAHRIKQDDGAAEELRKLKLSPEDYEEASYWAKMHYTYDDSKAKIRYIILETDDRGHSTKRIIKHHTLCSIQDRFLESCLETTPKGYDIVVAGHMFVSGADGPLFKNYKLWMERLCDFSKTWKGKILMICGHSHVDDAFSICKGKDGNLNFTELGGNASVPKGSVLLLVVSCDGNASYAKYAAGGAAKIKLQKSKANTKMTKGTVNEHCFDVVTFTGKEIRCTRIGAGEDRRFRF